MRVLILNQACHPDPAATAQHAHDLARALVARGHEVHVVASRSVYGASGATLPKEERVDGVAIHRVGVALFGKKSLAGRMADFALFHILATWRMLLLPRQDAVVSLTTPPLIGLAGWLITRLRGGQLVSWVMDLYPAVAVAGGVLKPDGIPARLLGAVNRFVLRRSARVVVLGRCMRERVRPLGVKEAQLALIAPWAAEDDACPPPPAGRPLTIMYSGNLGLAHDTAAFKRAMLLLKDDIRIRFVFSGGGKRRPDLEAFVKEHALKNVFFLPYLPREALAAQLAAADVHLISQLPAFTGLVVPSKLYGVLAIGRAAAVVAPQTAEVAQVVNESGCGAVFEPGAAGGAALADWLVGLAADRTEVGRLGQAALAAHAQTHAPALRLAQWVNLLESLAARPA